MRRCLHFLALFCLVKFCLSKKPLSKPRLLPGRIVPRVQFFQNCENVSHLVLKTRVLKTEISLLEKTNDCVLNIDFINEEEVPKIDQFIARIQRCLDSTKVTCQHFQTLRFNQDLCGFVEMKGQIWSPMLLRISPHVKCPIQAGEYHLRNGTIDMMMLSRLPMPELEKHFWRVRIEGFRPKFYLCFDGGYYFDRTRS